MVKLNFLIAAVALVIPQLVSGQATSIRPPGGTPSQPAGSTLVQIGFTYGLNWPFVVSNPDASAQIFRYTPPGISYGISIREASVVMHSLVPYNTQNSLGYITTLARFYIPSNQVSSLSLAILNPSSRLYSNPNSTVNTLMRFINPAIPLLASN